MNFETEVLAALSAAVVSRGGTPPPLLWPESFSRRSLALLDAFLLTTAASPVPDRSNYGDSVLSKLAAAIAAEGGVVPGPALNFEAALLAHLEALAVAMGRSLVGLPVGLHDRAIALLDRLGPLDFSALPNLPESRRSSPGWVDQRTVDTFAKADLWIDAYSVFSNTAGTTPAVSGDRIAAVRDNVSGLLLTQGTESRREFLAVAGQTPYFRDGRQASLDLLNRSWVAPGALFDDYYLGDWIIGTIHGIAQAETYVYPSMIVNPVKGAVHLIHGNFDSEDLHRIRAFLVGDGCTNNNWAGQTSWGDIFLAVEGVDWLTPIPPSIQVIHSAFQVNYLQGWTLPLPEGITDMNGAFRVNEITSWTVPIPTTATVCTRAWRDNPLTHWAPGLFDGCGCTQFLEAFFNTTLTTASIDNILVSINSNGTSGGTFGQSGGSAPSATGQAAITAMRSRGWTVVVTGGF